MTVPDRQKIVVIVSGRTATGKSAFAYYLQTGFGFHVFRTKDYLRDRLGPRLPTRASLIQVGEQMDERCGGRWIVDAISGLADLGSLSRICVDRVRKPEQVTHVRARPWRTVHVHFVASPAILQSRFMAREPFAYQEDLSFSKVIASDAPYDLALMSMADATINTDHTKMADVAASIVERFRLS